MIESIYCQLAYAAAGALFNLASWTRRKRGLKPFTATSPAKRLVSMLVVALVTLSFAFAGGWISRAGWIYLIVRMAPGGIHRNMKSLFVDRGLADDAAFGIGLAAASISLVGVTLGLTGLILARFLLGAPLTWFRPAFN